MKLLVQCNNIPHYKVLKSILDANQINVFTKNEKTQDYIGLGNFGFGFNIATGPIELFVHESDYKKAKELISQIKKPDKDESLNHYKKRVPYFAVILSILWCMGITSIIGLIMGIVTYRKRKNLVSRIAIILGIVGIIFTIFIFYTSVENGYIKMADEMYSYGNIEGAIQNYNQAISLNPWNLQTLNKRGICYTNIGQYDNAIIDFSKITKLQPNKIYGYSNLAFAYYLAEQYKMAISTLNIILDMDETNLETRYFKSLNLLSLGFTQDALDEMNSCLKSRFLKYGFINNNMDIFFNSILLSFALSENQFLEQKIIVKEIISEYSIESERPEIKLSYYLLGEIELDNLNELLTETGYKNYELILTGFRKIIKKNQESGLIDLKTYLNYDDPDAVARNIVLEYIKQIKN